jgi:hypothetical protein
MDLQAARMPFLYTVGGGGFGELTRQRDLKL